MLRKLLCVSIPLVCLLLVGCSSGRCTVTGKVTYEDGTPVEGGSVIGEATTAEGKLVAVQATIQKDGSFSWGGDREGDGALPGQYKVIVVPVGLSEYEQSQGKTPAIDGKYGKYDSSGLSFEVKDGKNEFNITVSKPKPKVK